MSPVLMLGSGQLGLMLAAAGARLGIAVDRLDLGTGELIPGTSDYRVKTDFDALVSRYSLISAELEHLPNTPLVKALTETDAWCNKAAFQVLPDRKSQKSLLDNLHINTAAWQMINSNEDLQTASEKLGNRLVIKTTREGYDGRGQWQTSNVEELDIPEEQFGALIAEQHVPFERELSLIASRTKSGQTVFYPLTENRHSNGILRYSLAPTSTANTLQTQAESMLSKIMTELSYTGTIAMECFQHNDTLLVNELAPRVHNSGHWTQLGALHSQFDLHLRALANSPLPNKQQHQRTLMLNLIGCHFNPSWLHLDSMQCHWYGKSYREGRKLGHINLSVSDEGAIIAAEALLPLLDETHAAFLREAVELSDSRAGS